MTNYVLVHDAWHGAWAWEKVVPLLESGREDHQIGEVVALDLPGHGEKAYGEIRRITRQHYLEAVITPVQLNRLTDVVLVGQGFAGTFLPLVAAELGDIVKRVVFVAGMLPPEGEPPFRWLPLSLRLMVTPLRPTEKGVTFPRPVFRRMLCNGVDDELVESVLGRLVPDPYLPWTVPVSRQGFVGRFPTTYVLLTRDRAISPSTQRRYAGTQDAPEIVELAAGHEASLTHPEPIAELLLSYA